MWGGVVALFLAWIVFALGARARWRWTQLRQREPHSPVNGALLLVWIKLLVSGETETEPETDTEPEPRRGRGRGARIVQVAENRWHVERYDRAKDKLPPATPSPGRVESQLHTWIQDSFDKGARYSDVVRDGQTLFRKSPATIKRAIAQVKKTHARERAAGR